MSIKLPPVPHAQPVLDPVGFITPVWGQFLQALFKRAGGSVAESNDELYSVETERLDDAAVTEAKIADGAVTPSKIPDASIDETKLADSIAGNGLSGAAGSALAVNVDGSTLEIASDSLQVKDGGLAFAKFLGTDWTNTKAASGSLKLPSGLILKWGVTGSLASGSTTTTSFSSAFPTGCFQVLLGIVSNSATATSTTGQPGTGNYTVSGFDLYNRTSVAQTFNWFAVGY